MDGRVKPVVETKKKFDWLIPLEVLIQTIILCQIINAIGIESRRWWTMNVFPNDFIVYLRASTGNFQDFSGDVWSYKDWIGNIFTPLQMFNPFEAWLLWCGLETAAIMYAVHKMFEVKWGWVFVLPVMSYFSWIVQIGNIQGICLLTAFYPIPALLAELVKPHYAIFSAMILGVVIYQRRNKKKDAQKLIPFVENSKKIERIYAGAMIAFILIAWPTNQHAIDHALGSGTALTRPENLTFILPAYYGVAKAKGWNRENARA